LGCSEILVSIVAGEQSAAIAMLSTPSCAVFGGPTEGVIISLGAHRSKAASANRILISVRLRRLQRGRVPGDRFATERRRSGYVSRYTRPIRSQGQLRPDAKLRRADIDSGAQLAIPFFSRIRFCADAREVPQIPPGKAGNSVSGCELVQ